MTNGLQVVHAWDLLLQSADGLAGNEAYKYDLVDLGRQVCQTLLPFTHSIGHALVLKAVISFSAYAFCHLSNYVKVIEMHM
jgi:hypothetical protein